MRLPTSIPSPFIVRSYRVLCLPFDLAALDSHALALTSLFDVACSSQLDRLDASFCSHAHRHVCLCLESCASSLVLSPANHALVFLFLLAFFSLSSCSFAWLPHTFHLPSFLVHLSVTSVSSFVSSLFSAGGQCFPPCFPTRSWIYDFSCFFFPRFSICMFSFSPAKSSLVLSSPIASVYAALDWCFLFIPLFLLLWFLLVTLPWLLVDLHFVFCFSSSCLSCCLGFS